MNVRDYSETEIETEYGHFTIRAYRDENGGSETVLFCIERRSGHNMNRS